MPNPCGSPVVLHLEIGGEFLLAMLENYGVQGWNRWLDAVGRCVPGYWGEAEAEPPLCFWYDLQGVDLSGRNLDGIDLGLAWCKATRFDGGSLVNARIGCCKDASFRTCDLRNAHIGGDITGVDFSGASLDGLRLDDAAYDPAHPPVGLSADLLRLCRRRADVEGTGGRMEHPVPVKASLMDSSTRQ